MYMRPVQVSRVTCGICNHHANNRFVDSGVYLCIHHVCGTRGALDCGNRNGTFYVIFSLLHL